MLYREIAPVSNEAWQEMEQRLREVFTTYLSARKVVKVDGPKGFDFNVITEGRLANVSEENNVSFGNYAVLPLTETRVEFELNRWELDNVLRGAGDVDYGPLEEAAERIALFEDKAVYNGLKNGNIKGMIECSKNETVNFGNDAESIMNSISKAVIKLRSAYQTGPYTLIVGAESLNRILSSTSAYPLDKRIQELLESNIVYSEALEGAILVPYNHEDLELTIGKDLSLGYQNHTNEVVRFFISESFTFRVLDPSIIVSFSL